jgi:hypothetical protein
MSAPLDAALDLILGHLGRLEATGDAGFEGFMRDVLVEVTGMPFHLAKSGPQGGSDVRAAPSNAFAVGLEAKRYKRSTPLPLDQLEAKIHQAAEGSAALDLWILATTRPISITDREALAETAAGRGIKVVVLDWPTAGSELPALAVLLAKCPHAVRSHLGEDEEVVRALDLIRTQPNLDGAEARLRSELSAADVGYTAAARRLSAWNAEAQSTVANAKARLRSQANLFEPGIEVINRTAVEAALDQWWRGEGGSVAVLGHEGMGKTWAVLAWWRSQLAVEDGPLTLFVPGTDAVDVDVKAMVARLLFERTGIRDTTYWRRRLEAWGEASPSLPILLILDGLNQNWNRTDWANFLQPLFATSERGRFRVLMTCWPDWWHDRLGELATLEPQAIRIDVPGFTDLELDALLASHNYARRDLAPGLLSLMRVPRLSLLALKHKQALEASGDMTPERLAYEDWKDRLRHGSARATWSDEEFKAFVADMARDVQRPSGHGSLSAREIMERLGHASGADRADLSITLQDLVAGRWLERIGPSHHYRINPDLAPFALGFGLAAELAGLSEETAEALVAEAVDPLRDHGLGVGVLRAAVTAALLDSRVTSGARRAILTRWLGETNFSGQDFEAWWRLIGADPELVLDLIERAWIDPDRHGSTHQDEIFIKGLANAHRFTEVAKAVSPRMERWLGWVWLDPDEGRFLGPTDPASERSRSNRERTQRRLALWSEAPDRDTWPVIELRTTGKIGWLTHRAVGVLSFVPRAPHVRALVAWAIGRAIMGTPNHRDEVAWLLRLNGEDVDAARQTVLTAVERLIERNDIVTTTAARWLLNALGDRASLEQAASLPVDDEAERWREVAHGAGAQFVHDPDHSAMEEPTNVPAGGDLWTFTLSHSAEDSRFDHAEPWLARLAPDRLRSILADAAASATSRTDEELDGLARGVPQIVIALTENERETLAATFMDRLTAGDHSAERTDRWERATSVLRLWGRPAPEQMRRLAAAGWQASALNGMLRALLPALTEEHEEISSLLPAEGTDSQFMVILTFIGEIQAFCGLRGWGPLAELVTHADPALRQLAFRAAAASKHEAALRDIAQSAWVSSPDASREDRAHGSAALSAAADAFNDHTLLERADPEVSGLRISQGDRSDRTLNAFHAYMRSAVEGHDRPGPRTFPMQLWNHGEATHTIVTERLGPLLAWLRPWLANHQDLPNMVLFDDWPLTDITRSLIRQNHDEGLQLWRRLKSAEGNGIVKSQETAFLPLEAPPTQLDEDAATEMLEGLTTDARLARFAYLAIRRDHAPWLADRIRAELASGSAAREARGWRLLGYADATEPFTRLWEELPPSDRNHGWLTNVAATSRQSFDRNRWARHWYGRFLGASSPAEAYANFRLMLGCVDQRVGLWLDWKRMLDAPLAVNLNAYWALEYQTLKKRIEDTNKDGKDRLFGLSTMRQTQWPWF